MEISSDASDEKKIIRRGTTIPAILQIWKLAEKKMNTKTTEIKSFRERSCSRIPPNCYSIKGFQA
jgi:hypothetical protein